MDRLKVFLVEDEYIVRQGIKNNIDWESHGYDFCGEASDGELALPMIRKLKPDIVITDIKMPFMDGLTLSRLIKKDMPWVEIIILTGYEEFDYAKEAIKIGIAEFLSKPISGDNLIKEMDALSVRIEDKRKERLIKEKYLKEMEESTRKEQRELFQYLVTGTKSMEELLDMAGQTGMDLSALWYNIILLKTKSIHHDEKEYSKSLIELEQRFIKLEEEFRILAFDRNLEGNAFILKADSEKELEESQKNFIGKMEEILSEYAHVIYFGGIGQPVNRLRELSVSFEKASHAFAHRYLVEENLFLDSANLQGNVYMENEEFSIDDVRPKQLERTKIQEFLKVGDREEIIYFVEEFFGGLGSKAMKSNIFRQYIIMDVYFVVLEFLENMEIQAEEIVSPDKVASALQTQDGAKEYVIDIINKAILQREKHASGKYTDLVENVKRYIEENYADEDLSLNQLAAHVNFSPNHLSTVFSQKTGQPLIKYVSDFRMNKAKELLRCTNKKSSEISIEVGYKDPHYFSYLFKKTQGMTPTEYRVGKKA